MGGARWRICAGGFGVILDLVPLRRNSAGCEWLGLRAPARAPLATLQPRAGAVLLSAAAAVMADRLHQCRVQYAGRFLFVGDYYWGERRSVRVNGVERTLNEAQAVANAILCVGIEAPTF